MGNVSLISYLRVHRYCRRRRCSEHRGYGLRARADSGRPSGFQTGEVFSSRSLRGANCPRYNYSAARHIYARGNQIARYYSIPLSAKSAN